jgi:hypothetical protein
VAGPQRFYTAFPVMPLGHLDEPYGLREPVNAKLWGMSMDFHQWPADLSPQSIRLEKYLNIMIFTV